MALQPVERRSVIDEMFDQLTAQVLRGDLSAGEGLPSERRLAELFGVSRPSVREALRRLSSAGLVEVRQGDSTTVNDFRRSGSLGLLPLLVHDGGQIDLGVVRSIMETRLLVGPFAAAQAAERSDAKARTYLGVALAKLGDAEGAVGRQRAALDYWDAIVDAADSIVIRLLFNSLRTAYEPLIETLAAVMDAEVSRYDLYERLAGAVMAGNAEGAAKAASDLLTPTSELLLRTLEQAG